MLDDRHFDRKTTSLGQTALPIPDLVCRRHAMLVTLQIAIYQATHSKKKQCDGGDATYLLRPILWIHLARGVHLGGGATETMHEGI